MSIWDVDRAIDAIAGTMITKFYPSAIAKMTGLPLADSFERLLKLVEDGRVNLELEVTCPNCFHTVRTVREKKDLSTDELECERCGEVFAVSEEYLIPVFRVSPDYRDDVKKNHVHRLTPLSLRLTHHLTR